MPKIVNSSLMGSALVALMVLGCAPSLEQNPPRDESTKMPEDFSATAETPGATNGRSIAQQDWEHFFPDAALRKLIQTAIGNNQELNMQLQEIIIAHNEMSARRGEYMPRLSAQAGAGVEKVGKYSSQGVSDEAHGVPENLGDFHFGLVGSWEIDIWGKLRNATKSAYLTYLGSIEGKNFIVTQLIAEIANSYFELIALDNQLEVLDKNISLQNDALKVVRLQKQAARVTELAVQRFEAEVFKNKSRRFDLEQQRTEAENRINFLVGRFPQRIERDPKRFREELPDLVAHGIPSDLLDNRPDVRQAKLQLEAAKLDTKVAKANFYPSLSIEAGVGYRSFNVKHLIASPESLIYNLAGNLTAPLLNRSAINAQYRTANAQQLRAVYNYERSILKAYTDVANQLAMLANLKQSYELEAQQVKTLTQAIDVSNTLFQSARADYMEVLMTRRDSLDAEMELLETKKMQFQSIVNIYQALGGGWM